MTIQDWGSIGELVAAIATVATLVYLALQIRANTAALRMEARRAELQSSDVYIGPIIGSSDAARVFNEGLANPTGLAREDLTRFSFLMGRLLGAEEIALEEVQIGFASKHTLDRRKRFLRGFLLTPGGRWFWERFSENYPPGFQSHVDEIFRDAESAA